MLKIISNIIAKNVSILAYKSIKIHNSCGPSCNNVASDFVFFFRKRQILKIAEGNIIAAIVVHAILQLKCAKTYFCCQKIQNVFLIYVYNT